MVIRNRSLSIVKINQLLKALHDLFKTLFHVGKCLRKMPIEYSLANSSRLETKEIPTLERGVLTTELRSTMIDGTATSKTECCMG